MKAQCSQMHNRPLPLTPSLTRVHAGADTGSELFEPLTPLPNRKHLRKQGTQQLATR